MKQQISNFLLYFIIALYSNSLYCISLDEAFKLVQENAFELEKYSLNNNIVHAKADKLNSFFDSKIDLNSTFITDKNQSLSFPKDKMDSYRANIEITKALPSGTLLKGSFSNSYYQIDRPNNPTMPTSLNNAYEANLSFEVSQSLLRNFKTREISIQKDLILEQKISNKFQKEIDLQEILYDIEVLFLQYSFLRSQSKILNNLQGVYKKILSLMYKRKKNGRADLQMIEEIKFNILSLKERVFSLTVELQSVLEQIQFL